MLALETVLPSRTGTQLYVIITLTLIALLVLFAVSAARRRREQREALEARVSALESGAGIETEPADR